jgi:hypothetical protein
MLSLAQFLFPKHLVSSIKIFILDVFVAAFGGSDGGPLIKKLSALEKRKPDLITRNIFPWESNIM